MERSFSSHWRSRSGAAVFALLILFGAGREPVWAAGSGPQPVQGAVLGSFPTEAAAWASLDSIPDGGMAGIPPAMVCALDGIAEGPARLLVPAQGAAEAMAMCGTIVASRSACRPMRDPCSSAGTLLASADQPTRTAPPTTPTTAPTTVLAQAASPPLSAGTQGLSQGVWADLGEDLDQWPGETEGDPPVTVEVPATGRPAQDAMPPASQTGGTATAPAGMADPGVLAAATRALDQGDPARAVALLRPRAEGGDPVAAHNLALLLAQGLGTPRDDRAAAYWMGQAAKAGLLSAQNTLALMYLHGRGVPRDRSLAVRWLALAARSGHPLAQANLREIIRGSLAGSAQPAAGEGGGGRMP